MKVRKEPESITDLHLKFEGDGGNDGEDQQQSHAQQPRTWLEN